MKPLSHPAVRWALLVAVGLALSVGGRALADTFWNPYSTAAYGALQLAAATATKVPASSIGRGAIFIQNRDAASIFCGTDNAVTNSTGVEVLPNGTISIPVSFSSSSGAVVIWCYSVAGTGAGAVRWMETL